MSKKRNDDLNDITEEDRLRLRRVLSVGYERVVCTEDDLESITKSLQNSIFAENLKSKKSKQRRSQSKKRFVRFIGLGLSLAGVAVTAWVLTYNEPLN